MEEHRRTFDLMSKNSRTEKKHKTAPHQDIYYKKYKEKYIIFILLEPLAQHFSWAHTLQFFSKENNGQYL